MKKLTCLLCFTSLIILFVLNGCWFGRVYLGHGTLPAFLWPLPEPSSNFNVSVNKLPSNCTSYHHVDSILSDALSKNGYSSLRYYSIPSGYVISSGLERVDKNGYSVPDNRWNLERIHVDLTKDFFDRIYTILATQNPSHFRLFLLTVTDTLLQFSGDSLTYNEFDSLIGAPELPVELGAKAVTASTTCSILVYNFTIQKKDRQPILVKPGRITAQEHLNRAGILTFLTRKI